MIRSVTVSPCSERRQPELMCLPPHTADKCNRNRSRGGLPAECVSSLVPHETKMTEWNHLPLCPFSRSSRRFFYNCLVEILRILIRRVERTYMVLRRFQDGFLGYFHKHLGFLVADAVNLSR